MAFKRVVTQDPNLQAIQDNAEQALRGVSGPLTGGHLLKDVALTAGQDNLVPHGLSGILSAWIIVRKNANAVVWETPTSQLSNQSADSRFLNLRCSASCTVSIWVS